MNNKGMTTIELITSFALASVIFIILFNVTLALKDVYMTSGSQTNYLIEQANLSNSMNSIINSNNIVSKISVNHENISDKYVEYTFNTLNGNYTLIVDQDNRKISFNNYTYNLPKMLNIKLDSLKYISWNNVGDFIHIKDSLLVIDIPIYNSTLPDNYGVKVVYQANESEINIE